MIRIGDIEIHNIDELTVNDPPALFAEMTDADLDAHRDWLEPDYLDPAQNAFNVAVASWLIKTPTRTIILDTGAGNNRDRPTSPRFGNLDGPYLQRLEQAGVRPDDVDTVVLTHLHLDHVGWNTTLVDGAFVPTFANAQYLASATELEARDPLRGASARPPASWNPYNDSVAPIIAARQMREMTGTEEIGDGLSLFPIPGHAPGQMGLRVSSKGEVALFIADVVHQPIQVYFPHWNSRYCEDQDVARETRKKVFALAAEENALLLPAHFGGSHGGYIQAGSAGYGYTPLP